MEKPHYLDHRKRLRSRFQKARGKGLHDYEVLELLLTYAIPRKDVKPLAKELIQRFGGLSGALDASEKDLLEVSGMGAQSVALIHLVKEIGGLYLEERMKRRDVLSTPRTVAEFARQKLAGQAHESFMLIYLNVKNEVTEHEILQEGTLDHAVVYPRRVVEAALRARAASLILVHNHPSGNPEPSEDDRRLTQTLCDALSTVEVRVLDHLVVGKDGHVSFAERGWLEKN